MIGFVKSLSPRNLPWPFFLRSGEAPAPLTLSDQAPRIKHTHSQRCASANGLSTTRSPILVAFLLALAGGGSVSYYLTVMTCHAIPDIFGVESKIGSTRIRRLFPGCVPSADNDEDARLTAGRFRGAERRVDR